MGTSPVMIYASSEETQRVRQLGCRSGVDGAVDFFLFVGIFDLGFYLYAASCAQSAARIAAIQTASNPGLSSNVLQAMACNAAMLEMARVPNTHNITGCGIAPLTVTQQTLNNSTTPACADCGVDTTWVSSLVTVTYQ